MRLANFLRGPIDAAEEEMGAIYDALRLFQRKAREPRFTIERRLKPGASSTPSGARWLQGAYVDRDEIVSRQRVLQREKGVGSKQ